jgi:Flp pilus assembly protein CpaB
MVLAGVLGALLTLNLLRAADRTTPVLVAATELTPGTVIDRDTVRVAQVHADDAVVDGLVGGDQLDDVRGEVATAAVHEGALLTRDVLRPADAGEAERLMSFPMSRARAVGGKLATGDVVDVLAVERDTGRVGYVVSGLHVVAVDGRSSGPLDTEGDLTVTVSVAPADAGRLASALEVATVTLVRSTGAAPLDETTAFVPAGGSVASATARTQGASSGER